MAELFVLASPVKKNMIAATLINFLDIRILSYRGHFCSSNYISCRLKKGELSMYPDTKISEKIPVSKK